MQSKHLLSALLTRSLLFISLQASSHSYVDYPKARKQMCKDDGDDSGDNPPGNCQGYDLSQINTYPNWPQNDWQGAPSFVTGNSLPAKPA